MTKKKGGNPEMVPVDVYSFCFVFLGRSYFVKGLTVPVVSCVF